MKMRRRRMIEVEKTLNSNKVFLELLEKVVEAAKKKGGENGE
ncbi:MAG: hypothetical protein QXV35_05245 [Archaeoglobaceae archaeon]